MKALSRFLRLSLVSLACLAAGCSSDYTGEEIESAMAVCNSHGGIDRMPASNIFDPQYQVICKDGIFIQAILKEPRE